MNKKTITQSTKALKILNAKNFVRKPLDRHKSYSP